MSMRFLLLVAFLAFAGSAQAQLFGEDDSHGWGRHRKVRCHCWLDEGWRDEERAESWRRHHVRDYAGRRHYEADEDRGWWRGERREGYRRWWRRNRQERYSSWRYREKQEGYHGWRHPERDEMYRGWWRPEGGWRDSELRDGPRRCRPPMHAAGDADVRVETARNLAIKAWQEQVINEHGERFLNFSAAYVLDEHCDPARVGEANIVDLKRCVLTAAPCLTPREGDRTRQEEERRHEEEHH